MDNVQLTEREAQLLRDFNKTYAEMQDKILWICARIAEDRPVKVKAKVLYLVPKTEPRKPKTRQPRNLNNQEPQS